MERNLAQPGFWMAGLLVLLIMLIQMGLAAPLEIIDVVCERVLHRAPPRLGRQPLVLGSINLVAFGTVIVLGLHLNRLSFRRAFPIGPIPVRQAVGAAITILGATVVLSEVDNVLRALLPPPQFLLDLFRDLFLAPNKLVARFILLVLVAPVTEELLFRGIILRGLLSRYRPAVAVTLTALMFAALHANPWQFLSALFLGIALGWFYWRTGSVLLCVLGHGVANVVAIIFALVPVDIPGLTGTPDYGAAVFQPWWVDLVGLGVLVGGLWLFARAAPPVQAAQLVAPPVLPPKIN